MTALITHLEKLHSALLIPYIDTVRSSVKQVLMQGATATSLDSMVRQEAYVLAYKDLYQIIFIMGILALIARSLMKTSPLNSLTPGSDAEKSVGNT